jgi:hypothetical protein
VSVIWPLRANFSRGELTPKLHARADLEQYLSGLAKATNVTVMRQGGIRRRPGSEWRAWARQNSVDPKTVRLMPFVFSSTQSYVLEFGHKYIRFHTSTGIVTQAQLSVSGVSRGSSTQITTSTAHGLSNGASVILTGLVGMTQLNNRHFLITVTGASSFTILDTLTGGAINSLGYGAYVSGGTVSIPYEIATPYEAADVFDLDFAQSADVLTLTHEKHAPRDLVRLGETNWQLRLWDFLDGPFWPKSRTKQGSITASQRGTPSNMTISASSTYNTSLGATNVNDSSVTSYWGAGSDAATLTFTLGFAQVVDNYYIQALAKAPGGDGADSGNSPTSWTFQGREPVSGTWVTLDSQDGLAWTPGETKFFKSGNKSPYSAYRFQFAGTYQNAGVVCVAEVGLHRYDQTVGQMTFTLSSGAVTDMGGWLASRDVGRQVRMKDRKGQWNWVRIDAVSSTTLATGRLYGFAQYDTSGAGEWRLGAWFPNNWPRCVTYYQQRKATAFTPSEPSTLWMTKSQDYYDHGESDPPTDDDGITLTIVSSEIAEIRWIQESGRDLLIGTTAGVRVLGPQAQAEGFSGTNLDQQLKTKNGTARIKPIQVAGTTVYVDYFGKKLREFVYDMQVDNYVAPEMTILSDHLLEDGVVSITLQTEPDTIIWIATTSGYLVAMTYERDQKIIALTDCSLTSGSVRSLASIPGPYGTEVYMVVERGSHRTIERLSRQWETLTATTQQQANFSDCAFFYSGSATQTVSGLWALEGQSVHVLADGQTYETTVSGGSISLATPAFRIIVGLPVTAYIETLRATQTQDGALFGRQSAVMNVFVDVLYTLGIEIRQSSQWYEVFRRDASDPASGQMNLRTGAYRAPLDPDWTKGGAIALRCIKPLPMTLRALVIGQESEP